MATLDELRGILGILAILGVGVLLSTNRRAINRRLILSGVVLHLTLAFILLKIPQTRWLFEQASVGVVNLLGFAGEGTAFVFGPLVTDIPQFGFIFAFQVLPVIIFFSALTSLLFHFGILQAVIRCFGWVLSRAMRLSGAEGTAAAANCFIGQIEAPLIVKRYLPQMTRSELMALMTGGMATVAGAVLVAYIGLLGGDDPAQQRLFAQHLLTASILNAPAALLLAKLLIPETETFNNELPSDSGIETNSALQAISDGTEQGLKIALMIGAVLVVFTALVALVNGVIQPLGSFVGIESLTLQTILGAIFAPFAWLIGVSYGDIQQVGTLLGEKIVLNEFFAYVNLSGLLAEGDALSQRSAILATYALCGFANLASIGIQIGGIGILVPERRAELCAIAPRAMIAGALATLFTASVASLFIGF